MVITFVDTAKLAVAINLGVHPVRVYAIQKYAEKSVVRVDLGVHNRLYPRRILDIDTDTAREASALLQKINPVITSIEKRSDSAGCWGCAIQDVAFEVAKNTQTIIKQTIIKQGDADKTDQALLSTCSAILEWCRMEDRKAKPFTRDGNLASEWLAINTLMNFRGTNAILYLLGQVRPRFTETGWIVESY